MVLKGEVSESYDLMGDTRRVLPRYRNFVVAYQRPGDANPNTLIANFPMRPVLLLGPDELKQANVRVDVIEPASAGAGLFDTNGGQVAAGGVRIVAAASVFTDRIAMDLRPFDNTDFFGIGSRVALACASRATF